MITSITPYLTFNDNCEEALRFYSDALHGEIKSMMKVGEGPKEYHNPEHNHRVMHAELKVGEASIMASDSMGRQINAGSNTSLTLNFQKRDELEHAWKALCEGGEVAMELQDTFWGARFGMVQDRYGINWMLNCSMRQQ